MSQCIAAATFSIFAASVRIPTSCSMCNHDARGADAFPLALVAACPHGSGDPFTCLAATSVVPHRCASTTMFPVSFPAPIPFVPSVVISLHVVRSAAAETRKMRSNE